VSRVLLPVVAPSAVLAAAMAVDVGVSLCDAHKGLGRWWGGLMADLIINGAR